MCEDHPTIIYRHRKENLKKCSLKGLENRKSMIFYTYPKDLLPHLDHYLTLDVEGEKELSYEDASYGILLIDGTWRYADRMTKRIDKPLIKRRLPSGFTTAYPRKQTSCPLPEEGLASIEALYIAYRILNRDTKCLLDGYYWKEAFLTKNELMFSKFDDIINNSFKTR